MEGKMISQFSHSLWNSHPAWMVWSAVLICIFGLVLSFCCIGVYVSFPKGSLFKFFKPNFRQVLPLYLLIFLFWPLSVDFYERLKMLLWGNQCVREQSSKLLLFTICVTFGKLFYSLMPWFLMAKDNISLYLRIG